MFKWEDIFLLIFMMDYVFLIFCRIADRTRLVEVYRGRKIFCNSRRGLVVYTLDFPYYFSDIYFMFGNDTHSTYEYSIQEIRHKVDREIKRKVINLIIDPLHKLKVVNRRY